MVCEVVDGGPLEEMATNHSKSKQDHSTDSVLECSHHLSGQHRLVGTNILYLHKTVYLFTKQVHTCSRSWLTPVEGAS